MARLSMRDLIISILIAINCLVLLSIDYICTAPKILVLMKGYNLTNPRECLEKWNEKVATMYEQCQLVGSSRCMMVYYEQLVLHPSHWMREILTFLDVPWNESVLHHEDHINKPGGVLLSKYEKSTDQVKKPVYIKALSLWVRFYPEDVVQDMAFIAPMLTKLGYDPQMPTYHWGLTRTPYSPKADLVGAYRKANWKRLLESTSVKPRIIDEARSQEVDDFYKLCQMHRDQYQDHSGRLHPLKYFMQTDEGWNAPKLTKVYLDFPTKYVEYKKPPVIPKTYARSVPIPYLPERNLVGRYNPGSDNLYNR